MKLTNRCEYALLAMHTLAGVYTRNAKKFIPIKRIAEVNSIPKEFLEKIVALLSKTGYVESLQGSHGGIHLAKDPKDISVAQIIRVIDGPLAPVASVSQTRYAHSPIEKSKGLIFLFKRIRDIEDKILSNTTFADLL